MNGKIPHLKTCSRFQAQIKKNQVPLVLKNSRLHSMPVVPPCCVYNELDQQFFDNHHLFFCLGVPTLFLMRIPGILVQGKDHFRTTQKQMLFFVIENRNMAVVCWFFCTFFLFNRTMMCCSSALCGPDFFYLPVQRSSI